MKGLSSQSIALICGVLMSLASFVPATYGQAPARKPVADTTSASLNHNQVLRLRLVTADRENGHERGCRIFAWAANS